jgi:hypothetical protein
VLFHEHHHATVAQGDTGGWDWTEYLPLSGSGLQQKKITPSDNTLLRFAALRTPKEREVYIQSTIKPLQR